ncbi:type VI secretion system Vgr family protein [Shewanella sp. YLB-07]|uniref:type VI secretion system Vgr family protein n=1 Tax=Shewanella sp. YLB-07 TaxID=2601268 RepID=UPI00128E3262|nr:type VI secretion system tip protein VgrG [Shewanella sp. YLB-07]MPY21267.1 type VI secretion system tip protein VgrG [Shewanella sp. YLB-07]MPY22054.1 type VI secretion system tip protein VgrG [Shewanella sp. YLB-07]
MIAVGNGLRYHFSAEGVSDDSFEVLAFDFKEGLSSPFEVKLTLLSRLDDLTPESIVDQTGLLTWYQSGELQRQVHGIVSQFSKADTGNHHTQYHITLVPALSRLKLRQNSRIFQQKSVLSIIATLLTEMGIKDYAFSCDARLESQVREYCVQYRETDFDFISRLAAEVGLFYYFQHSEKSHTLVFSDSTTKQPHVDAPFPYNAVNGGAAEVPFISSFSYQHQIKPASVTLKDNSFKKPQYSFLQTSTGKPLDFQRLDYEHFDYPGRYKDDESGIPFTQVRQEFLRRDAQVASGKSNLMQAVSGSKFDLMEHGDVALNRDWLMVTVTHKGEQGAAAEEANTQAVTTYSNTFTAIPGNAPWQAEPNAKPLVTGPQSATVVGPKDEEIFCDEFGRVKVQFPWDRYGYSDDNSSCWVRVSQGWAGGQYGMMAIPRIGHEVIVSFLEGDPDQPIITGRTFHSANQVPYPLPANKTRTVLKTQTHKGEGSNELRFEDEAGQEEIYIHAQKDINTLVEHDQSIHIKHDAHLDIENERFTRIKTNDHLTVEGDSRSLVKQDVSINIDGSQQQKVGKKSILEAGTEVHLKAGTKIVIEAGAELTLKVGGSFLKVDPAGVHLVGPAVNLNSGGSAGSGSGYAGQLAALPGYVDAVILPESDELTLAAASMESVTVLDYPAILQKGALVTELCHCNGEQTCSIHST